MKIDVSCYLVLGPENCGERKVKDIVRAVVSQCFTTVQIRSKIASFREMMKILRESDDVIKQSGKDVALIVDDRLDIAYAAREEGIKVGIHIGQDDAPFTLCRKLLGEDAIIGVSPPEDNMLDYIQKYGSRVDYFGVGPLRDTETKPDCGLNKKGEKVILSLKDIKAIARISPVPVTVGGGVNINDLKDLKKTGVAGFFTVSAICKAENPEEMARRMVEIWRG